MVSLLSCIFFPLAKGKKVHDKRETIKNRDSKRDLARIKKTFNT